jgi:hypothetical protein
MASRIGALTGRQVIIIRCWDEKGPTHPNLEVANSTQRFTVFAHKGKDEKMESKGSADGGV